MREMLKILLIMAISYLIGREQGTGYGMVVCFLLIGFCNKRDD